MGHLHPAAKLTEAFLTKSLTTSLLEEGVRGTG